MRKIFQRVLPLALALSTLSLSLAGCGGGASKSSAASATTSAGTYLAETGAAAYDNGYGQKMELAEEGMPYEAAPPAAPGDTASSGGTFTDGSGLNSSSGVTSSETMSRKLIRTVRLNVETDTFDDLLNGLQNQITALGGYVEQSDISGVSLTYRNEPGNRYASITARVPNSRLNQFVSIVEENGNVIDKSESTEDVTLRYSDLESRKKSLTIEQERIWELLEKADTLEAVITLEERLSEIRYELESMESQLRLYDNQVDYSTIYIYIDEVTDFTPVGPETTGQQIKREFLMNLRSVGNALTALLIFFITTAPVWFPLLIIAVVITAIVKRRKKAKQQSGGPAAPSDHTPAALSGKASGQDTGITAFQDIGANAESSHNQAR